LGDFATGTTVRDMWNSSDANGSSITRATNGTISVYKDGGLVQSTAGVTDTEDFDGLTGVHLAAINTAADGSFYSAGSDFIVVLSAAVIDTRTVNAALFSFSLNNRSLQNRVPAALVSGRIDGSIGAVAANAITAAALADGAIDAATFAAGAINAAAIATDAITAASIAADAIGASEIAADAVTEIQSGLGTSANQTTMLANLATIAGYIDTEVAAIKAKTDNLPASPANEATLTTIAGYVDTEVAAIKAKTDLIPGTVDGKTFAELVTLMAAVLLGKASGLEGTAAVYRAVNDSKDRVTATVDAHGNRTALTLDAS